MVVNKIQRAVGVFSHYREAERALQQLQNRGFPMDQVSVIAKSSDVSSPTVTAGNISQTGNKADESAVAGAATGGVIGVLTGLLVGLGVVMLPGVGPILVGGAAATALVTALTGGTVGAVAGGLLGGLIGLGIPEDRARAYHDRLGQGGYLIIIEGSEVEVLGAEKILQDQGIQDWGIYDLPPGTVYQSNGVLPGNGHNRPGV